MDEPVWWYSGPTVEEAQRRYEEDAARAWADGYEVVRAEWETRQPWPTLFVEYRYRYSDAWSAPKDRPKRVGGALIVGGVVLAVLLGLFVRASDRDGSGPSAPPLVARSATRSSERTPSPTVVPRPPANVEVAAEVPATSRPSARPDRGPDDPDPTPTRTSAPEPTPTLEPTPTPTPTSTSTLQPTPEADAVPETASVDEPPLDEWSARLSWRWLERDEFRCESVVGRCWGILVLAAAACPDGLEVAIDTKDARGRFIGTVSESRREARRGTEYLLIFESPNRAARRATVSRMVCD